LERDCEDKDYIIEKPLKINEIFISFAAQFKGLIQGYQRLIDVDDNSSKGGIIEEPCSLQFP